MQYRVTKNRFVDETIAEQFDYYAEKQDLKLAERWEEAVLLAIASLKTIPSRGAKSHFHHKRLEGLLWITIPAFPFRMFYFIDESAMRVKVVAHAARWQGDRENLDEGLPPILIPSKLLLTPESPSQRSHPAA